MISSNSVFIMTIELKRIAKQGRSGMAGQTKCFTFAPDDEAPSNFPCLTNKQTRIVNGIITVVRKRPPVIDKWNGDIELLFQTAEVPRHPK